MSLRDFRESSAWGSPWALQGVYVVLLLTADGLYGDTFRTFRHVWLAGLQCRVAGFLLTMSLQVSTVMTVLLVR